MSPLERWSLEQIVFQIQEAKRLYHESAMSLGPTSISNADNKINSALEGISALLEQAE